MIVWQNDNFYLIPFFEILLNVLLNSSNGVLFAFDASDDEMVLKVSVAEDNSSSLFYNELYSPIITVEIDTVLPIDCIELIVAFIVHEILS